MLVQKVFDEGGGQTNIKEAGEFFSAIKKKLKETNKDLAKCVLFPEYGISSRIPEAGGKYTTKFSMKSDFTYNCKQTTGFVFDFLAVAPWQPLCTVYECRVDKRWRPVRLVRSDGMGSTGQVAFADFENEVAEYQGRFDFATPPSGSTQYNMFGRIRLVGASANIIPIDPAGCKGDFQGGVLLGTNGLVTVTNTGFATKGLLLLYLLQSIRNGWKLRNGEAYTVQSFAEYTQRFHQKLAKKVNFNFIRSKEVASQAMSGGGVLFPYGPDVGTQLAANQLWGNQPGQALGANAAPQAQGIAYRNIGGEDLYNSVKNFLELRSEKYLSYNYGNFTYKFAGLDDEVLNHIRLFHQEYAYDGYRIVCPLTEDRCFYFPYECDRAALGIAPIGIVKYNHPTEVAQLPVAVAGQLQAPVIANEKIYSFKIEVIRHFEGLPTDEVLGVLHAKKAVESFKTFEFLSVMPEALPSVFTISPTQVRDLYDKLRKQFPFISSLNQNDWNLVLGIQKPPMGTEFTAQMAKYPISA